MRKGISSGSRIHKRQCFDELTSNFHKKLKLDDEKDVEKESEIEYGSTSNALILYKNPASPVNVETIPKYIMEELKKSSTALIIEPIFIPKKHLSIETIFKEEYDEVENYFLRDGEEEKKTSVNENDNTFFEMELD